MSRTGPGRTPIVRTQRSHSAGTETMNASFGNPWKVYICLFSFRFTSLAALGASFETFRSNWEEELVAKPAGGRSKVLNSFPESRHCQVGHLTILDLEPDRLESTGSSEHHSSRFPWRTTRRATRNLKEEPGALDLPILGLGSWD